MFESAALPHVIDKAAYKAEEPQLRAALLHAQFEHAGWREDRGFAGRDQRSAARSSS